MGANRPVVPARRRRRRIRRLALGLLLACALPTAAIGMWVFEADWRIGLYAAVVLTAAAIVTHLWRHR